MMDIEIEIILRKYYLYRIGYVPLFLYNITNRGTNAFSIDYMLNYIKSSNNFNEKEYLALYNYLLVRDILE